VRAGPPRVLVVDDEPTVREVAAQYLTAAGFQVRQLRDGASVMSEMSAFAPDLLVLDVMLPVRSGFDLLGDLRRTCSVPVILLTARSEEEDRVRGLELGADDYLVKPFSPRELTARVRSVLRRTGRDGPPVVAPSPIEFDGLTVDPATRETRVGGQLVSLTAKEFDLLAFLAAQPRQVFSRGQLLIHVWDSSADYQDPATVTVHVRRIRNKIEADPEHPRWISTVFGVGYRFEP
jgi:DNA-binding response OmpR family regulator